MDTTTNTAIDIDLEVDKFIATTVELIRPELRKFVTKVLLVDRQRHCPEPPSVESLGHFSEGLLKAMWKIHVVLDSKG